jgi:hypothetical protein
MRPCERPRSKPTKVGRRGGLLHRGLLRRAGAGVRPVLGSSSFAGSRSVRCPPRAKPNQSGVQCLRLGEEVSLHRVDANLRELRRDLSRLHAFGDTAQPHAPCQRNAGADDCVRIRRREMSETKERSIFSTENGSWRNARSEENPVPKSSIASSTPRMRRRVSISTQRETSPIATLSVSSSVRRLGDTPANRSSSRTRSAKSGAFRFFPETLMPIGKSWPCALSSNVIRAADRTTQSVSASMVAWSLSATGMKTSGGIRPSTGWCHSRSVSKLATLPCETIG